MAEARQGNLGGRPATVKAALRRALSRPIGDGRRKLDEWAESIVENTTDPRERREILASLGEIEAPGGAS